MRNNQQHYSTPSIALHWLMAVLLIATATTMEFKGVYPKGSAARDAIKGVHYLLGISVFILVWARLLARSAGTTPPIHTHCPSGKPASACWCTWDFMC